MAMSERAYSTHAYEEAQSFEQRRLRVLDGSAAREKRNAHRADVIKIGLVLIAIMVYLLSVTMMEAKIGNMVSRINGLQRDIEDTANASLRADLQIGELSSLDRIETYAVSYLGMVSPGMDDIHCLNGESSQRILAGQQEASMAQQDAPAAEEEAAQPAQEEEAEQPSFWQNLSLMLKGYWNGQAKAEEGK